MKIYKLFAVLGIAFGIFMLAQARTPFPPWLSGLRGDITIDRDGLSALGTGVVVLADMASASVDSDNLVDGTVALIDMASASVDSDNIVDLTIAVGDMAANSIDSDQYVDGSVDLAHMSSASVDSDNVVNNSLVEADHLEAAGEGLQLQRVAVATYDFAVDGGAISTINLGGALPNEAHIEFAYFKVITQIVDGGAGTVALQCESAGDIFVAADISGSAAGTITAGVPVNVAGTVVDSGSDGCQPAIVIGGATISAGKLQVVIHYTTIDD